MAAIKFPPGTMWWRGGIGLPGFSSAPAEFSPLDLSPALWIDPSDASTVTISGSSGAYIGPNGLVLSGVNGNYSLTPDFAALDITGSIDLQAKVTLTDWTPASNAYILAKYSANTGYGLRIDTSGVITLLYSAGGVDRTASSTVATGTTDGTSNWVRATLDTSTGTATFYTSTNGSSWTQLGATVAGTSGALVANASNLLVGTLAGTGGNHTGTIHRAIVKNGIDGTTVFDADFENATPYVSAFTESAYGAPVYVVSSTATSATANYSYIGPLGLVSPGAASNYGSTPDLAAHRGMTTLDIIAKASLTKWGNGVGSQNLVYKAGGGAKGYALGVTGGGLLYFSNHTVTIVTSTVAVGFADGATRYVRALATQSTDVKFYTSTDGIAWTQLGTTVAYADTFAADTGTMIFGNRAGGEFLSGTLMQVQLWNGDSTSGGTKVLDADFAAAADYATSFTESSSNAATVTITATNTPARAAGALVSQINDKSGNARHLTQGTAALCPKYWNGINGLNCLYGDADLIVSPDLVLAQPLTLSTVLKHDSGVAGNNQLFGNASTTATLLVYTNGWSYYAGVGLPIVGTADSKPHVLTGVFDAASSALRLDGSQINTTNPGTSGYATKPVRWLGDGAANKWVGCGGEWFLVSGKPSMTDADTYLKNKWGTP